MLRRVGAHASASRAAMGEDLGLFRAPGKVSGTAPQSASIIDRRLSGTVVALTTPVPDRNSGIGPLSRNRFHIALTGRPFNSGIGPREQAATR